MSKSTFVKMKSLFERQVFTKLTQPIPIGVVFLFIGIVASWLLISSGTAQTQKPIEEPVWPVASIKAELSSFSPYVPLFGRVETPLHSTISAMLPANIDKVHVKEGQLVKAGELLISLNTDEALLALQQKEADLAEAKARLAKLKIQTQANKKILTHQEKLAALEQEKLLRKEKMLATKAISAEQFATSQSESKAQFISLEQQRVLVANSINQLDIARANIKRASAQLNKAQLDFSYTKIKAPYDAVISKVMASVGERTQPGNQLLTLFDRSSLELRANIPNQYLQAVKSVLENNGAITAHVDFGEAIIPLQLRRLTAQVKQGRSGVDGLFSLDINSNQLALGQVVKLIMKLPARDNIISVPPEAVYNNNKIYVIESSRLKAMPVDWVGDNYENGVHRMLVSPGALYRENSSSKSESGRIFEVATTKLHHAKTGLKVSVINDKPLMADR
ncbi:efflux RND transporter periplasmic adaptor subunit [Aliikangiella coralliicola]|uniref:efflux RND transporter periplasmic adaptor subunit n=1 Tax=Aliikangiella coralliicola TaxID=2592383 RepID=UPI00143D1E08|nr:HlyD family efflux transporter periplasmic adaptor subunit [Aliikangiella coralliicola]